MEQSDVIVVGGGPAGAYCAFELARKGTNAIILDPSHPREKPCGGGILPAVIGKFPFVEKLRSQAFTFSDLKIISCINIQVISSSLKNGFCVRRQLFDENIIEMAKEAGTKVIKEQVIDIKKKESGWLIKTNKGLHSAQILVGADGVNSIVRQKIIGPISNENLALAFGYITTNRREGLAIIKFLEEIPSYIWAFPGKGYYNIGIGGDLKNGRMLKSLLDGFINSHFSDVKVVSSYAALLPSAREPKFFSIPCSGKDWILVGDAAGHVDPISGAGILYALWGARLAAESIEKNDLQSFNSKWQEEYGKNLIENCKKRDDFFDPLKSTERIFAKLANKTYHLSGMK
jgi:geranylgeranyl reductase family protein